MRRRAVLFLILTAVLWSTSGLLIKLITWQPLAILSGRSIVAAIVLSVYLREIAFRPTRLQVAGALSFVTAQLLYIAATKMTTAANAIFLQYTAPVWVLLFGHWFLKERPRRADYFAMLVIFAGLLLFFGDDLSRGGLAGNVLAILSGVALAALMLFMRLQRDLRPARIFLLGCWIGALVGAPWLLRATFSPSNVGIILCLGVFQMGLASILYSIGIQYVPALEATLILTLEPILNPVWVFLAIGETPGPLALAGGVLVLGAVVARAIASARAET
jgi:drug/metabolite transporter (DMT)-like permease